MERRRPNTKGLLPNTGVRRRKFGGDAGAGAPLTDEFSARWAAGAIGRDPRFCLAAGLETLRGLKEADQTALRGPKAWTRR